MLYIPVIYYGQSQLIWNRFNNKQLNDILSPQHEAINTQGTSKKYEDGRGGTARLTPQIEKHQIYNNSNPRSKLANSQKRHDNPQEDSKNKIVKPKNQFILATGVLRTPHFITRDNNLTVELAKSPSQINHNLSAHNLRNSGTSASFARRKNSKLGFQHEKESTQTQNKLLIGNNKNLNRSNTKKCKEIPSFIRNKHSNVAHIADFQKIKEFDQNQSLVRHKKLGALFQMTTYRKQKLLKSNQLYENFKSYIKCSLVCHRLIVKMQGYFWDEENIYVLQEYLPGIQVSQQNGKNKIQFNDGELGIKIYQILAILIYLQEIKQPHLPLTSNSIVYSMNTCKLKRSNLIYNKKHNPKDKFYHIWCLGNLIFELITGETLVSKTVFQSMQSINQIFNSPQMVKCIEVGFKRLESFKLSRELIEVLIATLWTVQNNEVTYESLLKLQLIKMYRDDDLWNAKINQN